MANLNSMLFQAVEVGNETTTKLLLDSGADINKAREDGRTPLFIAAQNGHDACVKVLLEAGADKDKAETEGVTPLYMAAGKGHDACVKLLLDATYNDIADKVLVAVSQQDIIFDTAFIIFKKTVELQLETIKIKGFNINDTDTHKKLYNIFYAKFSETACSTPSSPHSACSTPLLRQHTFSHLSVSIVKHASALAQRLGALAPHSAWPCRTQSSQC